MCLTVAHNNLPSYSSLNLLPISGMWCFKMPLPSHFPNRSSFPEPKYPDYNRSFTPRIWALSCRAASAQTSVPRPESREWLITCPTAQAKGHAWPGSCSWQFRGYMKSRCDSEGVVALWTVVNGTTIWDLKFHGLCWHSAVSQDPQAKQTRGL